MKHLKWTLAALGGIALLGLLGLAVKPTPFPEPVASGSPEPTRLVPIPDGLPAPVERWYRADYPAGLPVYDSVVMSGRGVMRVGPVSLPFRHAVEFRPGKGFLRRMDITWFNVPVLHGLDTFVGGRGVMKTPVGPASGPKIDQGASIVSWLEVLGTPGVLAEEPGVRWEPVGSDSARLVVPFGDGEDSVLIGFDPTTAEPVSATTERYRGPESETKTRWVAHMNPRREFAAGYKASTVIDIQWDGDKRPWATFECDTVTPNAAVPGFDAALAAGGVRIGDAR